MSTLKELWEHIEFLKEDLEKLSCDVKVTVDAHPRDHPEASYAELAARLRKAFGEEVEA